MRPEPTKAPPGHRFRDEWITRAAESLAKVGREWLARINAAFRRLEAA